MSRVIRTFAVVLLLSAASVIAQVAKTAEPHTVSQVVDFWVTNTEQLIVPAADAMPKSKYSFAPSNGEFSGVRTVAEQVKHLAAANNQLAAATLGEEPPVGTDHETAPDSVKTKAQVMDYLKGSFASLHRAAVVLTIAWMSAEAAVSLFAAWRARSPALLAFGDDSAIELASAVVVLWRFSASSEHAERKAAWIAGTLLFALAACVIVASFVVLLGYSRPEPTVLGIAILVAAAVLMPLLAREKRRLSAQTASAALRAERLSQPSAATWL